MRHFCCEKAANFKLFGLNLELDFTYEKIFGLWLDLDWVLNNQDWIWIAKFDSPLISDAHLCLQYVQGRTQVGVGLVLIPPFEFDVLQNVITCATEINCFRILVSC